MIEKIRNNPRLKQFVIGLISPHRHPRPRLWVRWFVNPFVHKKGRGALIRRHARLDVFPWRRFEVGRDALIEDYAVVNNGAGDVVIGDQARIGIGSVIIGPVRLGDRAGLGQHVFISGFNHGYADGTRDSNAQELVRKEVTIDVNRISAPIRWSWRASRSANAARSAPGASLPRTSPRTASP